jgi:outer membrane protein assembly factor BamB
VVCASRDNGQIYWMRDLNQGFKPKRQGGFLGIGATHTRPPIWASPIMVGNHLIFAGSSGQVASVNPKTGAVEKRVEIGQPVLIGPIAAAGTIYVVTDTAQLVALR